MVDPYPYPYPYPYICLSKPIECRSPKVNCSANYGLWVIVTCQCRFISCKQSTTLSGEAIHVWKQKVYKKISAFSASFCHEPKNKVFFFFLKKEVYLTLDTKHILIIGNKILCTLSESLIQWFHENAFRFPRTSFSLQQQGIKTWAFLGSQNIRIPRFENSREYSRGSKKLLTTPLPQLLHFRSFQMGPVSINAF